MESRFGERAEILSGCQMPPHSALPLLRQRDHISPTRWQSGVAMRGRLQASRTTPPRKALLPRARKYGQQRVLAVSSFGVGFSCGELPRPMSNPSKGLPDCLRPDRKAGHFGPREDNSDQQCWLHCFVRTVLQLDFSHCPFLHPLLFLSQLLIPNNLRVPPNFMSAPASGESSLRLCVSECSPGWREQSGGQRRRWVRDRADLEGDPEWDECLLGRIDVLQCTPLLICNC